MIMTGLALLALPIRRVWPTTRRIAVSGDDHPGMPGDLAVGAEAMHGLEVEVAFDRKAKLAAHILDLGEQGVA
jgi:hypothetical protein